MPRVGEGDSLEDETRMWDMARCKKMVMKQLSSMSVFFIGNPIQFVEHLSTQTDYSE